MPYRNFITLTLLAILAHSAIYGQTKQEKSTTIAQIKTVFHQINQYKNYQIITIDDSEEFLGNATDNGGSLKGYFKADSLKKIVAWVGLSNRVVENEYYFDKGKLVFVYSTDSRYKYNDSTGEPDYSNFAEVFKGRYYFSSGKLIHAILTDKEHEKSRKEDAEEFLSSSKEFMKILKAKKSHK
jgi:hypothetical protein